MRYITYRGAKLQKKSALSKKSAEKFAFDHKTPLPSRGGVGAVNLSPSDLIMHYELCIM